MLLTTCAVSSRYKKSKFQISGLVPAPVEYKSGLNVFVAEVSKFLVLKVISKIIRYRPKIFPASHWSRKTYPILALAEGREHNLGKHSG